MPACPSRKPAASAHPADAAWFFSKVRGKPVPSALIAPMSGNFVAEIERFAAQSGVELVKFGRHERKEERMRGHLHLGYDGKAVPSRSTGRTDAEAGNTSDPDADWGRHETGRVDGRTGKAWTRVKRWFGYGLHLVADVEHELPVWFEVTRGSRSEQKVLSSAVAALFGSEPALAA